MRRWRRSLLGWSAEEWTFEQRSFRCDQTRIQLLLERVGLSFLDGYHAALTHGVSGELTDRLTRLDAAFRGYAFEGASTALARLDALFPAHESRLKCFLNQTADTYLERTCIGVGRAMAMMPFRARALFEQLDASYGWLAYDGWGFQQGFFHCRQTFEKQYVPWWVRGYKKHCFDQGVGRSLWFVEGAQVERIADRIELFPFERRPALWSGIGFSCADTGGAERCDLRQLVAKAESFRPFLARGVALAARARSRVGHLTLASELASEVICQRSAFEAARQVDSTRRDLPRQTARLNHARVPAYAIWLQRLVEVLTLEEVA